MSPRRKGKLRRRYGRAMIPYSQRSEQDLVTLGRCSWETEYGTGRMKRCGHKAKPGHHFCPGHERDWRDLYPHLPLPMRKVS